MTKPKSTYARYVDCPEKRRIFEQERLILDATELLSKVMEIKGIKKVELAEKLGRSKAHVTQMLRGDQNLTLRTLADVFCVLDYRLLMVADPLTAGTGVIVSRQWNITQQGNSVVEHHGAPVEFLGEPAA